MIRDRVVFILGAGASVPFGFPTGSQLVRDILAIKKEDVPDRLQGLMCDKVNEMMGFDPNLMLEFQLALLRSQVGSIDEFLAQPSHKQFTEIGRFLIAAHLLPKEDPKAILQDGVGPLKNWYQLLWSYLRDHGSTEELLKQSPVAFITFNYDRSLEQYLFGVMRYHFGTSSSVGAQFLAANIFHVHGTLGAYRGIGGGETRTYCTKCDITSIRRAMPSIKIVHEVDAFPQQRELTARIEAADRIVFLGFHYHGDNVRKLFRHIKRRNMTIFGSSFGLSELESATARRRIAEAIDMNSDDVRIGGAAELGCYDYLRENFAAD